MDQLLLQTLNNLRDDVGKLDDKLEAKFQLLETQIAGLKTWKTQVMTGTIIISGAITLLVNLSEVYFNLKK